MAENQVTVEAVESNEIVDRAKGFWDKFSKPIIYVGSALILGIGGWYGYKNFVKAPNETKSAEAIFPAEQIFDKMAMSGSYNKDSVNLVLNGGNGITGVLKVASGFGGTAAGNRAHYIAGACYLQTKDFNNAVKHLKEFSSTATQIQTAAFMMLGDANAELKKTDEAYDYYKKATTVNPKDEYMTAEALYKAGVFAEVNNKTTEAIDFYNKIKNDYPNTSRARDIDKYLAKLGVLN